MVDGSVYERVSYDRAISERITRGTGEMPADGAARRILTVTCQFQAFLP